MAEDASENGHTSVQVPSSSTVAPERTHSGSALESPICDGAKNDAFGGAVAGGDAPTGASDVEKESTEGAVIIGESATDMSAASAKVVSPDLAVSNERLTLPLVPTPKALSPLADSSAQAGSGSTGAHSPVEDAGAEYGGGSYNQGPRSASRGTPMSDLAGITDPSGRFERSNELLGRGASKEVYKAFDHEEGVEVAWNQLKVGHINEQSAAKILSEIQILTQLDNENVIRFYHSWVRRNPTTGNYDVFFITELMTSGTLKNYLQKTKGAIKLKVIKGWCRQILRALHYLHTVKTPPIIHRDLKCDNVFINGNNGQTKLGDFGLAVLKNREMLTSVLGTPEFMAPELYDESYDERVDVYAFGMCLLEMVTKDYPYSECDNAAQIYRKVTQGIKPLALQRVPDAETQAVIERCIDADPANRPTVSMLLEMPFFAVPLPTEPASAAASSNTDGQLAQTSAADALSRRDSEDTGIKAHVAAVAPSLPAKDSADAVLSDASKSSSVVAESFSAAQTDGAPTSAVAEKVHKPVDSKVASSSSDGEPVHEVAPLQVSLTSISSVALSPTVVAASSTAVANPANDCISVQEPSAPLQAQQPAPVSACQVDVESVEFPVVHLRMRLLSRNASASKEVKFPFDLARDTIAAVVSEMLRESVLPDDDVAELATAAIRDAITEPLSRYEMARTNAPARAEIPVAEHFAEPPECVPEAQRSTGASLSVSEAEHAALTNQLVAHFAPASAAPVHHAQVAFDGDADVENHPEVAALLLRQRREIDLIALFHRREYQMLIRNLRKQSLSQASAPGSQRSRTDSYVSGVPDSTAYAAPAHPSTGSVPPSNNVQQGCPGCSMHQQPPPQQFHGHSHSNFNSHPFHISPTGTPMPQQHGPIMAHGNMSSAVLNQTVSGANFAPLSMPSTGSQSAALQRSPTPAPINSVPVDMDETLFMSKVRHLMYESTGNAAWLSEQAPSGPLPNAPSGPALPE